MTHIIANQLVLGYNGRSVINGLSLTAEPGEMLGLIGPNGAGKTTVLRALNGLISPNQGTVLIDDQDVQKLSASAKARTIGMVPQGESQVWPLSVEEVVSLGRAPHRGWLLPYSSTDRAAVDRALELTSLSKLRSRSIEKLSGGERQRVMIARALAQEPDVLLLDEPTANLDVQQQILLLELVRKLTREGKLIAVMAIHDLALAARYCDRLLLLFDGRDYATGPPEAVLTSQNLQAVFGVEAELYRDPYGQWALTVQTVSDNSVLVLE